jgi:hypothetical protein
VPSRTPALDVAALLGALERNQVRYVLIGGVAARLHGSPLLTEDVDITPAGDRENLRRLASALRELDAELRVRDVDEPVEFPLDARSFTAFTFMTFATPHGFLDICLRPAGTEGYRDLAKSAQEVDVLGLSVRVAALDDIIRSKQAAGRNKDLGALPILRELKERIGG